MQRWKLAILVVAATALSALLGHRPKKNPGKKKSDITRLPWPARHRCRHGGPDHKVGRINRSTTQWRFGNHRRYVWQHGVVLPRRRRNLPSPEQSKLRWAE